MGRRRPKFIGRGTVEFPSLKTDKPGLAPTSDFIPKGVHGAAKPAKDIAVPEGHLVGFSHKSNYQVFPKSEAAWAGGKKA